MKPSRYNLLAERLLFSFFVFLGVFIVLFRMFIVSWESLLALVAGAGAVLLLTAGVQRKRPESGFWITVRNWIPIPGIFFGYRMVLFLINNDRNHPAFMPCRDEWLIAADRWIFGADPTVWLERLTVPWLTELMQIFYAANYFLPLTLGIVLYLKGERLPYQKTLFAITLGYILSYLGYFVIPAIGPRFTLPHSVPLEGILIRERLAGLIYALDPAPRDCFPSGHTQISLVTLWLAYRFRRGIFYLYLPIVAGLVVSTVYLRYHYVIDVIAGAALAGVVIVLARGAEKRIGE